MTIEEAIAILEQHKIHRGIYDTNLLVLHHDDDDDTCELIGKIYTGHQAIFIADYIPSEIGTTYLRTRKSMIVITNPLAHIRLKAIIDRLPSSVQRYEESIRRERIENLHEYFRKRNEEWTARAL